MIEGQLVYLRPVQKEDMETFRDWLTDPSLMRMVGAHGLPAANVELEKWYLELFALVNVRVLSILTRDHMLIGVMALGNLFEHSRSAKVFIAIGDRSYWGRGFGPDAIRTLVRYAFLELNLQCIWAEILEFNTRALRAFEKCGFEREGMLRNRFFSNGQYWSQVVCSVLRDVEETEYLEETVEDAVEESLVEQAQA
jgi:RimJ/RimL family protein N-acetyltransferase